MSENISAEMAQKGLTPDTNTTDNTKVKTTPMVVLAYVSNSESQKDFPIDWDETMNYVSSHCIDKIYSEVPLPGDMANHIEERGKVKYIQDLEKYLSHTVFRANHKRLAYKINYVSNNSGLMLQVSVAVDADADALVTKVRKIMYDSSFNSGEIVTINLSWNEVQTVKRGCFAVELSDLAIPGRRIIGYTLIDAGKESKLEIYFEKIQQRVNPFSTPTAGHFSPMGVPDNVRPF